MEKPNKKVEEFLEYLKEFDHEMLYPTGHENAIVGIVERFGMSPVVVLDKRQIIRTLMQRDGMTEEGALEFFDFNIVGAWMGDSTPAYISFVEDVL